jgi:hypothetical protein
MSNGNDYPPSIPLCRLYERTSRKGTHYLTGRLGATKIVILKSNDTTGDCTPIWNEARVTFADEFERWVRQKCRADQEQAGAPASGG